MAAPAPAPASALDNPILAALTTRHAGFAQVAGRALRYPREVSPLAALREPVPAAFDDLRMLALPGEIVALATRSALAVSAGWDVVQRLEIDQMSWTGGAVEASAVAPSALGAADVPDMLALTALTKPGPFAAQTYRMGRYVGLRSPKGRLMAMAGERMTADAFTEISAVCTHPDFAGRGLARALVAYVLARLVSEGRFPILHVKTGNDIARGLYEKLGFRVSGAMSFVVMKRS
jgi:ribosomal protein S18 acetylase RimI-like enzyme